MKFTKWTSGAGLMLIAALATSTGCDLMSGSRPATPDPPAETYTARSFTIGPPESQETVTGASVTPRFFTEARIAPIVGRVFAADENQLSATPVAVISHALWARRFGSDPGLIGQQIAIDGRPTTVVGVIPTDRAFPKDAALWIPRLPTKVDPK